MKLNFDTNPVKLNLQGFHDNLTRSGNPDRVYYFEHGVAVSMLNAIDKRFHIWRDIDETSDYAEWEKAVAAHRFLGHEFFRVFPEGARIVAPRKEGEWTNESKGVISNREEFENFEWPDAKAADLSVLDYYEKHLPPDMKVFHVVDLWEVVRDLMGFETICFAFYEDPVLVKDIFNKAGNFLIEVLSRCVSYSCYGAIYLGDDLGYKTSLMISPDLIKEFILPWHKRISRLAHDHQKYFFFHSCGQIYSMIDEYIDHVKIDAKHSFEENVMPVEEVKKRYGNRLTLLGGVDVDLLSRSDPQTIYRKTEAILKACQPGGGYFLGAGNWITDYIPLDNYLAMLQAGRDFKYA